MHSAGDEIALGVKRECPRVSLRRCRGCGQQVAGLPPSTTVAT